jgi:hypothetical protein
MLLGSGRCSVSDKTKVLFDMFARPGVDAVIRVLTPESLAEI